MEPETQLVKSGGYHRSIMNDGEKPEGVKTTEGWVCPLCPYTVLRFSYLMKRHLNLHMKPVAQYGGYSVFMCKLECDGQPKHSHYHCPYCKCIKPAKRLRFVSHMGECAFNPDGKKPPKKRRCTSIVKVQKRATGDPDTEGARGGSGDADQLNEDAHECPVCLEKFPGSQLLDHIKSHEGVDVQVIPTKQKKKKIEPEESPDIEEREVEVEVEEEMEEEYTQSGVLAEAETVSQQEPSDDELAAIRNAVYDMTPSTSQKTPEKPVRKSARKPPKPKSQARFVEVPPELIQTLKEASANVKSKGERRELMLWAETVVMRMERLNERQRAGFRMNVETQLMDLLYGALGSETGAEGGEGRREEDSSV